MNNMIGKIRSAGFLSLATLLRAIGEILVQIIIANKFGASREVDALYSALVVPSVAVAVLASSLRNLFIPAFIEQRVRHDEESAWRFASSLGNSIIMFLLAITLVIIVKADFLISVLAPGFTGQTVITAIQILRILVPVIVFGGAIVIFDSVLYSYDRFPQSAMGTMGRVVTYVVLVYILGRLWGIYGVALAVGASYVAQLLILVSFGREYRFHYRYSIRWRDLKSRNFLGVWLQFLIISLIFRLSPVIDRFFGSQLGEGAIAYLAYMSGIVALVGLMCSNSVASVFFPNLVEKLSGGTIEDVSQLARKSIHASALVTFPVTASLIVLRKPIVSLFLERGEFSTYDTNVVSNLLLLSLGLMIVPIISSTTANILYSLRKVRILAVQAGVMISIQFLLSFILLPDFGIKALPIAGSISFLTGIIIHIVYLQCTLFNASKIPWLKFADFVKLGICTFGMVIVLHGARLLWNLEGHSDDFVRLIWLGCLIGSSGLVYFLLAMLLRIEETEWLLRWLRRIYIKLI